MLRNRTLTILLAVIMTSGLFVCTSSGAIRADAVVVVNSGSESYSDFEYYIQPYLFNFGVPYTIIDINTTPIGLGIGDYSLIIIGHKKLDPNNLYLDSTEQSIISTAVAAGAGLVNFDNDLSDGANNGRYQFIQDIFGFGYGGGTSGSGVTFDRSPGYIDSTIRINCWEDDHQDPVLSTTTGAGDLIDNDGLWTEFLWDGRRDFPAVFGGVDEYESYGLGVMRFYGSNIEPNEYDVIAHLYSNHTEKRYYYGFTPDDPLANYVDVNSTGQGADQFKDYYLGTLNITDGNFNIYIQDADFISDSSYPFFAWGWIDLIPANARPPSKPPGSMPAEHYITERHQQGETITTGAMTLAGVNAPNDVNVIATTQNRPFLIAANYGAGKAVQFSSYDWISLDVKGPVYGLDDLVWRSLVWSARKPFVMQALPPFLTMRVDDTDGGFWWIHIANEFGIKPWVGAFISGFSAFESNDISQLAREGKATVSIHAFFSANSGFFYYDHGNRTGLPDATIANNFALGRQWHDDYDIPISKYVLPHFYEMGTNCYSHLVDWGVEFVGTCLPPGKHYSSDWLAAGPYRLHEPAQASNRQHPFYYADYLSIPNHPELEDTFFNCTAEVRDDAGYEWYPSNDVEATIGKGTRQTKRELDSMVLPNLFTHEYFIDPITQENWRAILEGITSNVASYNPYYVTMDYACQYVRAIHNSAISSSIYSADTGKITTTLSGDTDMPTVFYVYTDHNNTINEYMVDVMEFHGSAEVAITYKSSYPQCDLNKDGTVDLKDYSIFSGNWGTNEYDQSLFLGCDFSREGVVNLEDLSFFTENWLTSTRP